MTRADQRRTAVAVVRHQAMAEGAQGYLDRWEKGDFDWAQLAMNYWPERVRGAKPTSHCRIAHGLEGLYCRARCQTDEGAQAKGWGDE